MTSDPVPGNNAASAATTVVPGADLAVELTAPAGTIAVGAPLAYTAAVVNNGPSPATGVRLTHALPSGATFLAASEGAYDPLTGVVTADLGDLAAGERRTVTIVAAPTATGPFEATARVRAASGDPVAANDAEARSTAVIPPTTVVGLRRLGFHLRPTRFALTFDGALDPGPAQDLGNYALTAPGRDGRFDTRDDVSIPLKSATYDPTAQAVTLTPRRRLNARQGVRLGVRGDAPRGLTDAAGSPLDGDRDGLAGGAFAGIIPGIGRRVRRR